MQQQVDPRAEVPLLLNPLASVGLENPCMTGWMPYSARPVPATCRSVRHQSVSRGNTARGIMVRG